MAISVYADSRAPLVKLQEFSFETARKGQGTKYCTVLKSSLHECGWPQFESGYPAIRSRIAIGDLSDSTIARREMRKVCSRAYCPSRTAWLTQSVKTIQLEPGGNSQRCFGQDSRKLASSFMALWQRCMKLS